MSPRKGRERNPDHEFIWNIGVISAQVVNQKRDALAALEARHETHGITQGSAIEHLVDKTNLEADIQLIEETIGSLIGREGLVQLPPYIQNLDEKPQNSGTVASGFSTDTVYRIDGHVATLRHWK